MFVRINIKKFYAMILYYKLVHVIWTGLMELVYVGVNMAVNHNNLVVMETNAVFTRITALV